MRGDGHGAWVQPFVDAPAQQDSLVGLPSASPRAIGSLTPGAGSVDLAAFCSPREVSVSRIGRGLGPAFTRRPANQHPEHPTSAGQPGSTDSIAARICGASGGIPESNRPTTRPSGATRNFSKFQRTSPA